MNDFVFPKWSNSLLPVIVVLLVVGPLYVITLLYYGGSPRTTDVGYQPEQPVEYSHALHVGKLGMDCRYCHTTVVESSQASIPPTQTCMNCHKQIRADSQKIIPVKQSYATGMPIEWIRVHDLPDYAYFDHSAHVTRGIGCVSCHGRVDKMEVVHQVNTLSMAWCLDCHRQPEKHLREQEHITKMNWSPGEDQIKYGLRIKEQNNINPSTDCSTCHR